jgi:hypothetical protein
VRGYRHPSVYKGRAFHHLLKRWLPHGAFEELARPFFCNALSLTTGASRFFGLPGSERMPVADAVYASACLPTIFEPAEIGGDHYVDGGMTETLALRIARARRADLVIGVDLSHRDLHVKIPYKASLPHILFQTYEVMGQALNEHNLHRYADENTVVIKPKVSHLGLLDMPDVKEIVRIGERRRSGADHAPADAIPLPRRGRRRRGPQGLAPARPRAPRCRHECVHPLRHLRRNLRHAGLRRGATRRRRSQAAQLRVHARHGLRTQLPHRRHPPPKHLTRAAGARGCRARSRAFGAGRLRQHLTRAAGVRG